MWEEQSPSLGPTEVLVPSGPPACSPSSGLCLAMQGLIGTGSPGCRQLPASGLQTPTGVWSPGGLPGRPSALHAQGSLLPARSLLCTGAQAAPQRATGAARIQPLQVRGPRQEPRRGVPSPTSRTGPGGPAELRQLGGWPGLQGPGARPGDRGLGRGVCVWGVLPLLPAPSQRLAGGAGWRELETVFLPEVAVRSAGAHPAALHWYWGSPTPSCTCTRGRWGRAWLQLCPAALGPALCSGSQFRAVNISELDAVGSVTTGSVCCFPACCSLAC